MSYYSEKQQTYFSEIRKDLVSLLPRDKDQSVLEIGAGGCDTLCYIKDKSLAKEVVAVELFELENSNQVSPLIDRFIQADIENLNLPLEKNSFDVIILADVLEHLVDPWRAVNYISNFLKKGGYMIVSLPNVRSIDALNGIIFRGSFEYTSSGVMDKTHLRFFCKKNMKEMLSLKGIETLSCQSNLYLQESSLKKKLLNKISFGIFEEFLSNQYIFKLRRLS